MYEKEGSKGNEINARGQGGRIVYIPQSDCNTQKGLPSVADRMKRFRTLVESQKVYQSSNPWWNVKKLSPSRERKARKELKEFLLGRRSTRLPRELVLSPAKPSAAKKKKGSR